MYTTAIADPDYFTSKQGVIDLAEFSQNTDNLNITAVQEVLKRLQSRCIRHSALTISRTVYSVLGENSSLKERQELTE
uniref:Kinesin motor domain-containing protein n=1 Tax=Heterorhabditis bacteriophora TaxID=37862 RepID=A0A1I7WTH7_HETBA